MWSTAVVKKNERLQREQHPSGVDGDNRRRHSDRMICIVVEQPAEREVAWAHSDLATVSASPSSRAEGLRRRRRVVTGMSRSGGARLPSRGRRHAG